MEENDYLLLELLNDEELLVAFKNADVSFLMTPLKEKPKTYEKYIKKFGRLDRKSQLVQKLLPRISFDLYKKGDELFKKVLLTILKNYKDKFSEAIITCFETSISIDNIKEFDEDEITNLFFKIQEVSVSEISTELFFVFLKLNDIEFSSTVSEIIAKKIEKNRELDAIRKQFENDIQTAIKRTEKQVSSKYEKQKEELNKQKRGLIQELSASQGTIKELESQLQEMENKLEQMQEKALLEYCATYEKEINNKKSKVKKEFDNYVENLNNDYKEKIKDAELEYKKKYAILQSDFIEVKKQLSDDLSIFKKENDEEREKIINETNELKQKKDDLIFEINKLYEKQTQEQEQVAYVEQYVKNYFESFDQRILERKIESVLGEKIGLLAAEDKNVNSNQQQGQISIGMDESNSIIVNESKLISKNKILSDDAQDLDDFVMDFKDNLSLHFNESVEIASVCVAAMLCEKKIILPESVALYVANSFSALIDLRSPFILDINNDKYSAREIVNLIEKSNSQVIYIIGVIDNFDESAFSAICRACKDRFIFFGTCNLNNITMMSKSIINYAVVLDIEEYLKFPEDNYILVGNYDLQLFSMEYKEESCKEYYKKYLRNLSIEKLIGQKMALDFSYMLQIYFTIISGSQMGVVLQRAILFGCDFSKENEEEAIKVLEKSGISIQIE